MTNNDEVRFTLRLPKKTMQKIKNKSDEIGISNNALVLQILWEWAERQNVVSAPEPPQSNKSA